jgi:hypothetical protein
MPAAAPVAVAASARLAGRRRAQDEPAHLDLSFISPMLVRNQFRDELGRREIGDRRVCADTRRWLRSLGYLYRHNRYVGGMNPHAKRVRIRHFIISMLLLLLRWRRRQQAHRSSCAWLSYIQPHHATKKGWYHRSNRDVMVTKMAHV